MSFLPQVGSSASSASLPRAAEYVQSRQNELELGALPSSVDTCVLADHAQRLSGELNREIPQPRSSLLTSATQGEPQAQRARLLTRAFTWKHILVAALAGSAVGAGGGVGVGRLIRPPQPQPPLPPPPAYPHPPAHPPLLPPPLSSPLGPSERGYYNCSAEAKPHIDAAIKYLLKSKNARALYSQLTSPPIVRIVPRSDFEVPFAGKSLIQWDPAAMFVGLKTENGTGKVVDQCGTNSPALILAHETHHSVWAETNPVGQAMLKGLSHPAYDNYEEARVILSTNHIAQELGEDTRVNHHGGLVPANSVIDRGHGICSSLSQVTPEAPSLRALYQSGALTQALILEREATGKASFYTALITPRSTVTQSRLDKAAEVFETHAVVTQKYAKGVAAGGDPITLQSVYQHHLHHAISVAESYRTQLVR